MRIRATRELGSGSRKPKCAQTAISFPPGQDWEMDAQKLKEEILNLGLGERVAIAFVCEAAAPRLFIAMRTIGCRG